ncbi:MAG: alpha-hydroxy-acid oxidizing enzyme [Nitrospirae bacterium GWC2_57_13]|jgi:4-hydroxymandelate oxidase|nr:MAG: alpha-hydroxy-acid oxidizing enzyme [Nitrospirae bacterium GWC1_57_7]OGW29739.1 MAG: alpha-hydroxy-acid oxidizing enzyme [Nitrospirae bacterium GWC2_57_13]
MELKTIKKNAREKLQGFCRVCPVCDGRVCAGEVPGMGGAGTGSAFMANVEALARHRLNMRTIHPVKEADLSFDLWGTKLSLPVLAAPMTGAPYNMGGKMTEEEFITEVVEGSLLAGTSAMTGDGADPTMYDSGLQAGAAHHGRTIAIIKPRQQEEIIKRIRQAEAAGVLAVGMDIDGAGLVTMALKGQPVSTKTFEELKEVVAATKLPFVLKGIMTPEEAELAVQAKAAAIVVSNHGGRVLDFTPGAAEVLPRIADRVRGKIIIFADGGVRSGADVLKLLALGADAVLVGRPLIVGAFGNGREGVALLLNKMKSELLQTMVLTGTADVKKVSKNVLYQDMAGPGR